MGAIQMVEKSKKKKNSLLRQVVNENAIFALIAFLACTVEFTTPEIYCTVPP